MKNKNWIRTFARSGYAARGVIYSIIGFFTFIAAFQSAEAKDTQGALSEILQQPFGRILMAMLIIGLISYALWRMFQAIADADHHGWSPKGIVVRLGLLASGATYASLAYYALARISIVPGGGGRGGGKESVIEQARGIIGEQYVSLVLALIVLGVACAHFYKAGARKYADHLEAGKRAMAWIDPIAISGLIARGLIFLVISLLLFFQFTRAGSDSTDDIPSMKDVFGYMEQLPFSPVLFAALGIGIMLFALYSFAEARWRRINLAKI